MQQTVGISEMKISNTPADVLITYSLGASVGIALYDPKERIGGLMHCMLPLAEVNPEEAEEEPCMFIDTGIQAMMRSLETMGAKQENMIAKVSGGAQLLGENTFTRIGARNLVALRKCLWRNNLLLAAEDTGGCATRTMQLKIDNGEAEVRCEGRTYILE